MSIPIVGGLQLLNVAQGAVRGLLSKVRAAGATSATPYAIRDSVELSSTAKSAAQGADALRTYDAKGAAVLMSGKAASVQRQENLSRFYDELGKIFAAMGIDTAQGPALALDKGGSVVVTNDHPDSAAIEEVFVRNPELARQFRLLFPGQGIQI